MSRTLHRLRLATALLAPLLVCLPTTRSQPAKDTICSDDLRELLTEVRGKHDLPALGAVMVRSKGVEALAVVGVRKRDTKVKATDDDLFHLGSDTKPWTALLIAWLVEQGLLDWDTRVADVFPELAAKMHEDWRKVTLGHLMTHRAGLPENLPGGWWAVPRGGELREQRLHVVKQVTAKALKSKPGEEFEYSNVGYVVAGAMAERVGKDSWESLLKKHLLEPMGVKQSGFGMVARPSKIDQPMPHDKKGNPVLPPDATDNPPVMGPAGRLSCSLRGWSLFATDQLRGAKGEKALLKPETYRKLHASPPGDFYTYGAWAGQDRPGKVPRAILAHDGTNTMNYASATLIPDFDWALLVVTNQGGEAATAACREVTGRMLKRLAPR